MDPGRPPELHDPRTTQAYKDMAVEVIRLSSQLDPTQSQVIDASPASFGGNPLGTDDGQGHSVNPVTGVPYEPNPVNAADLYRALAEYWADGPSSETPPGHWHALANAVSDDLAPDLRIGGTGPWSTGSSGTSSSTSPSGPPTTTPRSSPGAPRGTTTRSGRSP
jgi:hypothetical protein